MHQLDDYVIEMGFVVSIDRYRLSSSISAPVKLISNTVEIADFVHRVTSRLSVDYSNKNLKKKKRNDSSFNCMSKGK